MALPPAEIEKFFQVKVAVPTNSHFNIAPSQEILAIRQLKGQPREIALLQWGLIPSWMKEEDIATHFINARLESAAEKPVFRHAFKYRRCLIPANGFYEWKKTPTGKQPFYIRHTDQLPLGLAGLWEHWESKTGRVLESCTILTTNANSLLNPIHTRMPVILSPEKFTDWLDPNQTNVEYLKQLLNSPPSVVLTTYPISKQINNPIYNAPDNIAPL